MTVHILLIHGPNLNLLGEREPEVYGSTTLEQLNQMLSQKALDLSVEIKFFQNNSEGKIIDFIHENRKWAHGIIINPGALTHYSYSLRDAIASISKPAIEVHLSDIHKREPFRKISVIKEICIDQIVGFGIQSYFKGLEKLVKHLKETSSNGKS
ncbi:MAG: type II 3-dehydroquinate dehydratase [bacterium]|nr:MAG: type II 3-dehydroquinate dehydratase [bacterium]